MANDRPVLRPANGYGLLKGTAALNPGGRPKNPPNWREFIRKETRNGAEIHEILLELARGNSKVVTLLDGRQHIIIPTAEVRARVAIHLDEMLHGKAVTQTEQQKAEREASAMAAVRALTDEELERRVLERFERMRPKVFAEAGLVSSAEQVWEAGSEAKDAQGEGSG